MLAVTATHRGKGIATALVIEAIDAMQLQGANEVVLETEEQNKPAMCLYQRLGFIRSKKLYRYYLNGNSAYRLVLPLREKSSATTVERTRRDLVSSDTVSVVLESNILNHDSDLVN
jgi:peptide alpha-N-acetyltransferase